MWRNALIVGLVGAIAIAALVDTIQGGDDGEPATSAATTGEDPLERLTGPDAPPAAALPGSLVLVEREGCRLRVIEFLDASVGEPGLETLCRVWPSPVGDLAVVPTGRGERADGREIELVRLGESPASVRTLGTARGEVAWSADGSRLAWCVPGGGSVVLELGSGREERVAGCDPRFAPDGAVFTRPDRPLAAELLRNGEPLLGVDDFEQGFDPGVAGPIDLVEFDVSSDGVIAATVSKLAATGSQVTLQLWRERRLDTSFELPRRLGPGNTRFGGFLRFGPAANELAIGYTPGAGEVSLVDLELEQLLIRSIAQTGLAWSPDGAWLAIAVDDEIRVYGALRDEPSYVIPLQTEALGWIVGEEPEPQG